MKKNKQFLKFLSLSIVSFLFIFTNSKIVLFASEGYTREVEKVSVPEGEYLFERIQDNENIFVNIRDL